MVDDPLGVALVGVRVREVLTGQMGQRQRAVVEALYRRERTREQLHPAEGQPLVEPAMDLLRLDAGVDQLARHPVSGRRRVLEHELPGVGDEPDVERLGELLADRHLQLLSQLVDDLGRAGGVGHDQVDVAEAGVVVVVVDVHDPHPGALQELDRHAVHVPAVQEHDQALLEVRRRLVEDVVERHVAVLVGERELVGAHEHDRVLAQLLEHDLHRAERAEGVPVRVLVRREEELWRRAELVQDLLVLGGRGHAGRSPELSDRSARRREMRIPCWIESSCTNSSVGVRFIRSSSPTRCCR